MRPISSRAALLRGLACCVPSLLPRDAIAWCGDPFPPYAYSLPWFEFDAGPSKLPLRIVGDLKAEREQNMLPLLVLPSPGLSYEYLENLEALTISQRRVAFADLRTGAAAPDALVARILDAVAALESPGGVHLLGYGYGAALALRVYSSSAVSSGAVCGYDSEPACPATLCGSCCNPMWPMLLSYVVQVRVASLILASPLGTLDDAEPARREELATGLAPVLRSVATSGRACIDSELNKLRGRPTAVPQGGEQVGAMAAAARPGVPIMVTRGALDVSSEATAQAVGRAVPDARLREFQGSFPPVDDRARFVEEVLSFMDSVDGTVSRRAVMASGSMMPAGRL